MANSNSPFGLVPFVGMGGEGSAKMGRYSLGTALATSIGLGDPVKFAGDADAFGRPKVTLAGVTDVYVGVVGGFEYIDSSGSPIFTKNWVTGTVTATGSAIICRVYDDPRTLFVVQMSGALATTDIPNNVSLTAGSITNGISGLTMDSTTIATTNTRGFKILRLAEIPGNELGTYGKVIVQINRSQFADQLATGT